MPIEILMPALSPTMKEGNLAKWTKREGDNISAGDVIAEIETDKATMEVEAVDEGVLGKIVVTEGESNVPVNQVIAILLEDGEDSSILNEYKLQNVAVVKKEDKVQEKVAEKQAVKQEKSTTEIKSTISDSASYISTTAFSNQNLKASPVAKNIAQKNNLNLENVKGSGPRGRVLKEDVIGFLSNSTTSKVVSRNSEEFIELPNSNVRRVIANRLLESKQTIPHFYLTIDCNISSLLDMRKQVNDVAPLNESEKPIYKASVNDFVIKATALALKEIPEANVSWSDDAIYQYNNIDISVAVAIDGGLITPIIKNAEQKSVLDLSAEMKSLIVKAKNATLSPEEFQGGGFSISNLGMYGVKQFNAIVNPPQSAILAVGAGEKRVVVDKDGAFKAVDMMTVSLSCDHRSVDGSVGARFLSSFKKYIENPAILLL